MKRLARVNVLGTAAVVLLACGDDLGPRVPAAITVTPQAPLVPVGGTLQFSAKVVDASGREIEGKSIRFASSNTAILTVSSGGLLTSVAGPGTSLISMESGELTAEVEAEVVLSPSSLVVHVQSLELDTGEGEFLGFSVTDANGDRVAGARVDFHSSDSTIAKVSMVDWSDSLIVSGVGPGSATVTLTRDALSAEVQVTVGQFPSSITLNPTDVVLSPGGSQAVTAGLLDRTGEEIDAPVSFTWSSSDEAVATVSSAGLVTSVGPQGSAVITATTDTFSASLGVFVGTPPAGERLARVELPWARGLAVTADGSYFVSGIPTFARGALPDFALPVTIDIGRQASDIVVNASATRAYLILGSFSRGVVVVDLTTNSQVDFIPVSLGYSDAGALSPDGSVLTVGTHAGFERFDVASKRSLGGTAVGGIHKITHHPSKPLLYASGGAGVLELDPKSGEIFRRFPGGVSAHAVSPDGKRLYTIGGDWGPGVTIWNLETGAQESTIGSVYGMDLAVSPDSRFLYIILAADRGVDSSVLYIVDAASGAMLRRVVLNGWAMRIVMSADGIAVISNEGLSADEVGWVDFVR